MTEATVPVPAQGEEGLAAEHLSKLQEIEATAARFAAHIDLLNEVVPLYVDLFGLVEVDAVATYLGLAVDRSAMGGNSLTRWNPVVPKA